MDEEQNYTKIYLKFLKKFIRSKLAIEHFVKTLEDMTEYRYFSAYYLTPRLITQNYFSLYLWRGNNLRIEIFNKLNGRKVELSNLEAQELLYTFNIVQAAVRSSNFFKFVCSESDTTFLISNHSKELEDLSWM